MFNHYITYKKAQATVVANILTRLFKYAIINIIEHCQIQKVRGVPALAVIDIIREESCYVVHFWSFGGVGGVGSLGY